MRLLLHRWADPALRAENERLNAMAILARRVAIRTHRRLHASREERAVLARELAEALEEIRVLTQEPPHAA